jgi:hypothetical protein
MQHEAAKHNGCPPFVLGSGLQAATPLLPLGWRALQQQQHCC